MIGESERLDPREARFRTIFEQSPISMQIFAPDGTLIAANRAWELLWGLTLDQIGPYNVLEDQQLVEKGVTPFILRGFQGEATEIPPVKYEPGSSIPRLHDVPYRWIRSSIYPVNDADGELREVVLMHEDITAQKETEQQLSQTEELYRRIFEATADGLIINDPTTGCVVEANPAVCRMHGYSYAEFVGLHGSAFIHPDYHSVFADFLETISAGGTFQCKALDTRKDGSIFPVEVAGSPMMYNDRLHILAVVRDVTARVEAEEELEQRVADRTHELSTLLDVSRTITSTLELHPVLEVILDQLNAVAESDGASILALRDNDFVVLARRAPGTDGEIFPDRYAVTAHGPIWELLRTGEPAIINDIYADEPLAESYRNVVGDYMHAGLSYERSCMLVPMLLKDRVVGLVSLSSSRTSCYSDHHAALTLAIAQQAAVAIENARLYEEAQNAAVLAERQRLSRELHDSVSQALYSIALGGKTAHALLAPDSRAREPLEFVLAQAERGLAEMRALIFELRPQALEQEGLVGGLRKLSEALKARVAVSVGTDLCAEPDVPLPVKEALYRIAQEAMHNIVKHAQARRVRICLQVDDWIVMEIRDDGRGFDPSMDFPGHIGLHSMLERASYLGGQLSLDSAPGAGTAVVARFPLRAGKT